MVRTGRNTDTSSTPPPKRSRASASSSTSALKTIIAERDVDMNDTSHTGLVDLCEFIRAQYLTDLATKLRRYHEPTVRAFYDIAKKSLSLILTSLRYLNTTLPRTLAPSRIILGNH